MKIQRIVSNHLESNTFVLENKNQYIIIDAGAKLEAIEKFVNDKKVLALLLTHGHFDHVFNTLKISQKFDCKIYAAKEAKENLLDPAKNYGENFKIEDFSSFIFLNGDEILKLSDFEVSVYSLPGHSKCSLGYLINGILFAGDTLFAKGIGRTDLYGGDKNEMLSSLKKIQGLKFSQVASGHGEMSTAEDQKRNLQTFIRFLSR